ncbi:hypothetical protein EDD16DRAFT_1527591 [Pisolithus croceorrhizus]|nr:hypothetical protein EDD16DRAFT_1527591 [Pisolithus croceorrhizus]
MSSSIQSRNRLPRTDQSPIARPSHRSQKREPRQLLTRLPQLQVGYAHRDDAYTSSQPQAPGNRGEQAFPVEEVLSSPILNAHLGIELRELERRAERYRLNHPGENITRSWLSHFAGNLSQRGELLDGYRCYVIGCNQRNKRRDHILVHVGAHVDQRPFMCSVWKDLVKKHLKRVHWIWGDKYTEERTGKRVRLEEVD